MRHLLLVLLIVPIFLPAWGTQPFVLELSCGKMPKTLAAIREWTTNRSLPCEMKELTPSNLRGGTCKADVAKCLPSEVQSYNGKNPDENGPNCWNLAMVMSGILPALRYSSPEEMAFFMRSPLCRSLESDEPRQPGDIGALRSDNEEVHGFMWVSDDLVFTKNGVSREYPYELQSTEKMLDIYRHLQSQDCKDHPEKSCDLRLDTLRCQSLDKYLQDPKTKTPKKIQEALIRFEHAERCLSLYSLRSQSFDFQLKKNLVHNVQALAAVFDSPEFQESLNKLPKEQKDFIRGSLIVRLNSISDQLLTSSEDSFICVTCRILSKKVRAAFETLTK